MNKPKSDSISNTEGWKTINWRKAEKYIFKLQKRIYAASRCGDVKRLRKLQKTLMRSWSNRILAVRRVTVENQGKKTAGVDGIKSLSPAARLKLAGQLKLTGKSKPTRRIWIPKPGSNEKRPLSIPTIESRALQAVVKAVLEPEWEALFEPGSYGFRPGRSCQDAIKHIKNCIQTKVKYVLDADVAKCFDCINHHELLQKVNTFPSLRRQIKAWLKSGVIDKGVFTATSSGTPQGGILSPLLANIALHGLETVVKDYVENLTFKKLSRMEKRRSIGVIRYADDFVLLHENKSVISGCMAVISEWLAGIGLQLKPSKTRVAHTLEPNKSEDGIAGFDFLGHHIQQFPRGKYRSDEDNHGRKLGFDTLITPSKKAIKTHQQEIAGIIKLHRLSPQSALIKDLNPVIRGWSAYYKASDSGTSGDFSKQDNLVYLKLRRWGKRRTGNAKKAHRTYWRPIGNRKLVFVTKNGDNLIRLISHTEFASSSNRYVLVKSGKSPYDGDLVYWSTRLGRHPELPNRKAILLKQQQGKCRACGLYFREQDVMEVDHKIPQSIGGKDEWVNLQLLHRHCHDEKTALDGSQKSVNDNRIAH
ncbi:reverse transcriptase domain-containing protein [Dolichospermum sp. UHCC 0259]|uniref:group II intron reverse transcriptase/maturase n=1 Tax=Dolichospermum sp. UHCC 0259 TaxID=2590010 RepID=UPI001445463A|nr:reverse transcriptase domain-containing protein [Dolichospermum sp. UHCC 0259]MTJ50672.1 group II intron reverse transcriptase/maturase [Dolichospermum sp. UHCC 0259]